MVLGSLSPHRNRGCGSFRVLHVKGLALQALIDKECGFLRSSEKGGGLRQIASLTLMTSVT